MRITRILPKVMLVVGLVSIFLAGPNPATAGDPREPCIAAGVSGGSDIVTSDASGGGWSGFRCQNYQTGKVYREVEKPGPNGDTIKMITEYNNKPGQSYYVSTMTTTHKDKSTHVEQSDNTGRVYGVTDYYPGGRVTKYSKITQDNGGVLENSYYPNGMAQSSKIVQPDGSYKAQSFANNSGFAPNHQTSEETYDAKTKKVTTTTYNEVGQVTGTSGYTKVDKLGVHHTQGDQQQQGLISGKQQLKSDVPKQIGGNQLTGKDIDPGSNMGQGQPVTKNADGSTTSVTKQPDGSSSTVTTKPDGSKVVKNRDAKTGATMTEQLSKDGKTLGIQTFDAKGKQTSATAFGQDGKKTLTRTFDDKGGTITTKFNPDGRPTSIDTTDPNGKLTSVSCDVPAKCAKALNQQRAQLRASAKALKAGTEPQDLTNAKKNVRGDVLKQIGGKSHVDVPGNKEKLKTGIADQLKKRGQAVQLNPQPLPPGSPPDKAGGNKHLKNKINIGSYKSNTKEGFVKGEFHPGSKINGKVVHQSQSPRLSLEHSKHRPKINAMNKWKNKSKSPNWNTSAGSQSVIKHRPVEKPRSNH